MNEQGHPESLVPSHPGNTNALKSGAHSPRLIEARAAEIVDELGLVDELDQMGRIALWALGRQMAVLEAIDRDLSERGVSDRHGKSRYLLQRRDRVVKQLNEAEDRVLEARDRARKQRILDSPDEIVGETIDYVRKLQMIALYDAEARVSDQRGALNDLIDLGASGTTSHYTAKSSNDPYADDPEIATLRTTLEKEHARAERDAYADDLRNKINSIRMHGLAS